MVYPIENAYHFKGSGFTVWAGVIEGKGVWDGAPDTDVHAVQESGRDLLSFSERLLLQWNISREGVSTCVLPNITALPHMLQHTPACVTAYAHDASMCFPDTFD